MPARTGDADVGCFEQLNLLTCMGYIIVNRGPRCAYRETLVKARRLNPAGFYVSGAYFQDATTFATQSVVFWRVRFFLAQAYDAP